MADVRVAATLASLPRAVRLVAFDFDLCVLRVHSFGLRLEAADVAARDLGRDFVDLAFFVDLVRALVAAGVGVAVASFGRYEVIRAFLDRAFPAASPFTRDTISTPTTVGGMDGFSVVGGKNVQLAALAARFKVAPREILFFDGKWGQRAGVGLRLHWAAALRTSACLGATPGALTTPTFYTQMTPRILRSASRVAFCAACTAPAGLTKTRGSAGSGLRCTWVAIKLGSAATVGQDDRGLPHYRCLTAE